MQDAHDARTRLPVLEDSGEMLTIDAKRRFGQGLLRLLNVTGGMLGRGQKLTAPVADQRRVGQARPRDFACRTVLSESEFRQFSAEEANA
jgi:hypothetical protein